MATFGLRPGRKESGYILNLLLVYLRYHEPTDLQCTVNLRACCSTFTHDIEVSEVIAAFFINQNRNGQIATVHVRASCILQRL